MYYLQNTYMKYNISCLCVEGKAENEPPSKLKSFHASIKLRKTQFVFCEGKKCGLHFSLREIQRIIFYVGFYRRYLKQNKNDNFLRYCIEGVDLAIGNFSYRSSAGNRFILLSETTNEFRVLKAHLIYQIIYTISQKISILAK